jgi:hypothetical protein
MWILLLALRLPLDRRMQTKIRRSEYTYYSTGKKVDFLCRLQIKSKLQMSSSSTPFVVKTRAQTALFREQRDAALKAYPAQLEKFARTAVKTYPASASASSAAKAKWVADAAQRFNATVNGHVMRLVVEADLLSHATVHFNKTSRPEAFASQLMAAPSASSAEEAGRVEMHKFLLKEFDTWYAAFEAEEAEDYADVPPSAEARWTLHCAKKLSKRFGFKVEHLVAVVAAWLLQHEAQ